MAKDVAQCLRDHGWILASHSYGHPRYGDISAARVEADSTKWEETVPGEYRFRIKANRFLRGMVRAIVGSLLQVGLHRISISDFCQIIECKDRCAAGEAVPGNALFLEEVDYPADIFYTE